MNAIQELPDKDKNLILPIIPLRGWVGSQKLQNTIGRITKAIDERPWIADLDESFLINSTHMMTGEYPRKVFYEIESLLDPKDGYRNWCDFLREIPSAIPTLQIGDLEQIPFQIENLTALHRGLVVKFKTRDIDNSYYIKVIDILKIYAVKNIMIVFDYGQIDSRKLAFANNIAEIINYSSSKVPAAIFSLSWSSFPSSFSGYNRGENPIYERLLFNKVIALCPDYTFVYSDRASARAEKIKGGGGIPSPRIDYPLKNDWRYVREEFSDPKEPKDGEKKHLYTLAAKKLMEEEYWNKDLFLWGTQIIELTSKGDDFGIDSPSKATAVRINIHLHLQLHYYEEIEEIDTDDDWED